MTLSAAAFTQNFPEFGNTTVYPTAQITFWIGQAYNALNAYRFDPMSLDLAASLYVAHNMVLAARDAAAAAAVGGLPGGTSGPLASKAAGGLSVSYDTGASSTAAAGIYNATTYGQRLQKMLQTFCTGPLYVPGFNRGMSGGLRPGGIFGGWGI